MSVTRRAAVLLGLLASAFAAGCTTGEGDDGDDDVGDCVGDATAGLDDGHHNPGLSCIAAGCHAAGETGTDAPAFTAGGTLYADASGSAPMPGATVTLTDDDGLTTTLTTAENGNFWLEEDLAFPVSAAVERCDDSAAMAAPIFGPPASCNGAGCHDAGLRMHLP